MASARAHDYLYDSSFLVSGARDYARMSFKAAMASAQLIIQPIYRNMFSEMRMHPRYRVLYHPNCRLPSHLDRSYEGYLDRVHALQHCKVPDLSGKDRFKFMGAPKIVMPVHIISPSFHPPTPVVEGGPVISRNRGTQSIFRESSAQTKPWQPDYTIAEGCETTPEVLYLDKLEWGPGSPYRIGDLPVDFHTTEIVNKMRHARLWTEIVEKGQFPRWMKGRDDIICDVEMKDWIFREAEIDELQDIRLELLHRLQDASRQKKTTRASKKLAKLWVVKKDEMEKKIDHIRRTRDRERRKLKAFYEGGGGVGLVNRQKAARGMGSMREATRDPTSDLYAPLARHGYQARRRHAEIYYDPNLLTYEDHQKLAETPPWLEQCGQDLTKTCSGHFKQRDPTKLCERETKWSEQFLENLHYELIMARLGAAASAGPLRVLKPRVPEGVVRPDTPEVEAVDDAEETDHQCALVLQKILRGRAVQNLMYEGRRRAAELTEELKTTHGLQREDKTRIAREEAKARDYNVRRKANERKDNAISGLVDQLVGGAVSSALDFLEKELKRLKDERRQHAFILVALREKSMREAAEAGRRQKEERRRREHDEMFKSVVGVTQDTVDAYLQEIIVEGVELAAEREAVERAKRKADRLEDTLREHASMSTAEQHEVVAELVQQFLLPHAHKTATRLRIEAQQNAKLQAARNTIFKLLDDANISKEFCNRCGEPLDQLCRCKVCPTELVPEETSYRHDWRWKEIRKRPLLLPKTHEERFPMPHEMRCMLSGLVDDVVKQSRERRSKEVSDILTMKELMTDRMEVTLDAKHYVDTMLDVATGVRLLPPKTATYKYVMKRIIPDALERSRPEPQAICPKELPSDIRSKLAGVPDMTCRCLEDDTIVHSAESKTKHRVVFGLDAEDEPRQLLPSEVRVLEDMKKCKCDYTPTASSEQYENETEGTSVSDTTDYTFTTTLDDNAHEEQKEIEEEP